MQYTYNKQKNFLYLAKCKKNFPNEQERKYSKRALFTTKVQAVMRRARENRQRRQAP
ncbi:hypothetical protein QG37_04538 [Candidozyma auris]|uniref:Uncharacterized protein n=1 Tax=Candidozyma auris TaxID=498019 RepID=A0A0L0NWT0_CANAR|nr:hypothetical protein QG37_04538 [[Candida] auris]